MTRATSAPLGGKRLRLGRRAPVRSVDVRGDASAFEAVYHDAHQELYRYARSIVRDEHLAEDVLQSVMEKALGALQSEQRDFELRPWLFRITHNEAISRLRKERPTTELPEALPSGAPTVADQLDDRSRLDTLWTDLQALPDRQRQSLVLRELSGLSHEEIAAVTESTPRAVKQTIFEARRALADCEEGRAMVCDDVQRQLSDGDGRVRRGRRMQAHLRSCRDCRTFDRALNERPADLRMLAPALPLATATALFAQLVPGAKLATGAGSATAGAAGAAATGGLSTVAGSWSLSALGGALATKTAVIAATTVAAVGATGAVVVERATGPSGTPAPAAGVGKAASGRGPSNGNAPSGQAGGAATPPPAAGDRAPGPPATTPNATPRDTTPGSARGQERRAAGQARAAEARDRKAAASSGGKSEGKAKSKSTGAPKQSSSSKSSSTPKKSSSSAKSSNSGKSVTKAPAPSTSKGSGGSAGNGASKKQPSTDASPATPPEPSTNAGGSPPEQAAAGGSKKPEK